VVQARAGVAEDAAVYHPDYYDPDGKEDEGGEAQGDQSPDVQTEEGEYKPRGTGQPQQEGRRAQPSTGAALDEIPPLDIPFQLVPDRVVRRTVRLAVILYALLESRQVDRATGEHAFRYLEDAALEGLQRTYVP